MERGSDAAGADGDGLDHSPVERITVAAVLTEIIMSKQSQDDHVVRAVLIQTFPHLQTLPDELLDALVRGESIDTAAPLGAQPWSWGDVLDAAIKWAPFVAHAVAIVRGTIEIHGALRRPTPPTAAEIAEEVIKQMRAERPQDEYDHRTAERVVRNALSMDASRKTQG